MITRTIKEINAEIAVLKAIRPNVQPFSFFGDDNILHLDNVIYVLENRLSDSEMRERFEPLDEDDEEVGYTNVEVNLEERRSYEMASNLSPVCEWLEGNNDEKPSKGWPMKAIFVSQSAPVKPKKIKKSIKSKKKASKK